MYNLYNNVDNLPTTVGTGRFEKSSCSYMNHTIKQYFYISNTHQITQNNRAFNKIKLIYKKYGNAPRCVPTISIQ